MRTRYTLIWFILAFAMHPTEQVQAVHYIRGEANIEDVIPTGQLVGTGYWSRVVEYRKDPDKLVVKKSFWFLDEEYQVGRLLDHENIVKVRALYVQEISFLSAMYELFTDGIWRGVIIDRIRELNYSIWSLFVDRIYGKPFAIFHMVMDRIHGTALKHFFGKSLPSMTIESLLLQAQSCCLYLFDQHIRVGGPLRPKADWHGENVMLVDGTYQLKLVDLGYWAREENPVIRGLSILKSAQQLLFNILSTSALVNRVDAIPLNRSNASFPLYSFDADPTNIVEALVETNLTEQDFVNRSEQEIRHMLEKYFQRVLDQFQRF